MSWASKLSKPYRIDSGKDFRLNDFDPASTGRLLRGRPANASSKQSLQERRRVAGLTAACPIIFRRVRQLF